MKKKTLSLLAAILLAMAALLPACPAGAAGEVPAGVTAEEYRRPDSAPDIQEPHQYMDEPSISRAAGICPKAADEQEADRERYYLCRKAHHELFRFPARP